MDILFIGGTSFVGRHTAQAAIDRGHRVTLFHRGKTGADLFPEAEHMTGDRDTGLKLLDGRTWDAAIDVCGYVPRQVRQAAEVLAGSVGRYCYISSVSAYKPTGANGVDEDSPLFGATDLEDPQTETVDEQTYGPLEALCERAGIEGFGDRTLIVRPTYVVGPHDPTDRFTYWVRRASAGGEILAPGPADAPAQVIDARDLGAFIVGLVEQGRDGVFNGVGPADPLTFGGMLEACVATADAVAMLTWVDPAFLQERDVEIESAFPLWGGPEEFEMMRADPSKSIGAGLTFRPLDETIRDTRAWDEERGLPEMEGPISAELEAELLAAWNARG